MANDATIQVTGLKDLRKALRDVAKDAPKELSAGLAEASEIVASAARPKVPARTGRAAASIKVRKQSTGAALAVGGARAGYFPWLDFGGRTGKHKSVRRPFLREGRYIYPTLRDKRPDVNAKVDEVLARLAVRAGFDTSGDAANG